MEGIQSKIEHEPAPRDISHEFLTMDAFDFFDFLRSVRNESHLSITIDWVDVATARRLKAFIESSNDRQKRSATIRATDEQHSEEPNAFESGVKWEKGLNNQNPANECKDGWTYAPSFSDCYLPC